MIEERERGVIKLNLKKKISGANQIVTHDIFNLLSHSLPVMDQYNTGPPNYGLVLSITPLNKNFSLFHF